MSRIVSILVLAALVAIGVTFTVFNPHSIELNYLLGTIELPLALLTVINLAIGAGIGLLFSTLMVIRLKREIYQLRRKTRLAEEEVSNLRSIPIKDSH